MKNKKKNPWKRVLAAVRDMERTLALSWPVKYQRDQAAPTCRIDSDPLLQRHFVTLPSSTLESFAAWRPSVAHELCHAWLAENVDPIFSAWRFPRRCGRFTGQQLAEFQQRAHQMYLATSVLIDVWVDDLRHHYWPELTCQELEETAADLLFIVQRKRISELCKGERLMAIALHVVSSERHGGQKANMDAIYTALPAEIVEVIQEVTHFLQSVPRLSHERQSDLRLLEQYAQQSATLLNTPFAPRLVEEDGIMMWEIMINDE